jgi:hypothetical protein
VGYVTRGRLPHRVTTSRSKPPHDRSAMRPEADTMNQTVLSRFTPPERDSFKPAPLRASPNSLNYLTSDIRTKMAVVRLRQRKGPKRGRKWPKMGFGGCPRGSDKWPEKPTFCGFPTADQEPKKNIPNGQTGGGKLTGREHSFRCGLLNDRKLCPACSANSIMVAAVVGPCGQRGALSTGRLLLIRRPRAGPPSCARAGRPC